MESIHQQEETDFSEFDKIRRACFRSMDKTVSHTVGASRTNLEHHNNRLEWQIDSWLVWICFGTRRIYSMSSH